MYRACICVANQPWDQCSRLLQIVKYSKGECLLFLAYCSIFQMTTQMLRHSFSYDLKWGGSSPPLPIGFPAWLPMGCLARWNCFLKLSDCRAALSLYWIVASIFQHHLLTAPPFSPHFHPFKKVNDNGFYLMFFLLSHFPICSPICHCHLPLRLNECSFTPANRVDLTTDDDVDRGDGLRECKFIYVAFLPPNSLKMPLRAQCYKVA